MRIHSEKKIGLVLSLYQRLLPGILSSPPCFPTLSEERSGRAKRKGKNKRILLRFIFKLTYQMCFYILFAQRQFISPCEAIFRKQSSIIHITSQNRTYHQVHTWEIKCYHSFQLLPLSLCLKNVCRSLSTVWNYSPGWAEKSQSAEECHLDSSQCPLICHDSTAELTEMSLFCGVL